MYSSDVTRIETLCYVGHTEVDQTQAALSLHLVAEGDRGQAVITRTGWGTCREGWPRSFSAGEDCPRHTFLGPGLWLGIWG